MAIYSWFQRASVRETARLCCDVIAEWVQPKKNKRGKFLTPICYIALAHYCIVMAVVWKIKGGHSQDSRGTQLVFGPASSCMYVEPI